MKINTDYFGEVEYQEDEIITFPQGLYGFEEYHRFLPVAFQDDSDALLLLQSLDEEPLSFIVANPFQFFSDYHPVLSKEDFKKLGTEKEEELSFYVILSIGSQDEGNRVNLRCPLVINVVTRGGIQAVLEDRKYSFRHPLGNFGAGGEKEC